MTINVNKNKDTNTNVNTDDDKINNNINIKIDLGDLKKKKINRKKRKTPIKESIPQQQAQSFSKQANRELNKGLNYIPSSSSLPTIQELTSILKFRPYIESLGTTAPMLPYGSGIPVPSITTGVAPPITPAPITPAPITPAPAPIAPPVAPPTVVSPATSAAPVVAGRPPLAPLTIPPTGLAPIRPIVSRPTSGRTSYSRPATPSSGAAASTRSVAGAGSESSLATLSSIASSMPMTPGGTVDTEKFKRDYIQNLVIGVGKGVSVDEIQTQLKEYNDIFLDVEAGERPITLSEIYKRATRELSTGLTTPTARDLMRLERESERDIELAGVSAPVPTLEEVLRAVAPLERTEEQRILESRRLEERKLRLERAGLTAPSILPPEASPSVSAVLEMGKTGGLTGRSIYSESSESDVSTGGISITPAPAPATTTEKSKARRIPLGLKGGGTTTKTPRLEELRLKRAAAIAAPAAGTTGTGMAKTKGDS